MGKCQACGFPDVDCLIVHHIDHNKLNNSDDNLMVLCANCHIKYHKNKNMIQVSKERILDDFLEINDITMYNLPSGEVELTKNDKKTTFKNRGEILENLSDHKEKIKEALR